jgi:hypothetical protein
VKRLGFRHVADNANENRTCSAKVQARIYTVSKETYYSVKRDLQQCQKRPAVRRCRREYIQCQKRPTTVSKETYYSVKRDLQCEGAGETI